MTRSLRLLPGLLALGFITGCKVDDRMLTISADSGAPARESILLGTFENDTATPENSRFAAYQYYTYNPTPPNLPSGAFVRSPLVAPGYNSNLALGLSWQLIDVADGSPNYPGVGVRTVVRTGFVDLSAYDRIVFAHVYQHSGACKALQALTVRIVCDELNTSYSGTVTASPVWTNSSLAFSAFTEPSYLPPSGQGLAACLALANSVDFQAQADLVDGDCSSGDLALDNIEIRAGTTTIDASDG